VAVAGWTNRRMESDAWRLDTEERVAVAVGQTGGWRVTHGGGTPAERVAVARWTNWRMESDAWRRDTGGEGGRCRLDKPEDGG
jgi:hypothetical protein